MVWKPWVRQLEWLNSQLNGQIRVMFQVTNHLYETYPPVSSNMDPAAKSSIHTWFSQPFQAPLTLDSQTINGDFTTINCDCPWWCKGLLMFLVAKSPFIVVNQPCIVVKSPFNEPTTLNRTNSIGGCRWFTPPFQEASRAESAPDSWRRRLGNG